ncbi:MAG: ferritin-like domain-containing protein [Thermanaeromonas sp.]|uniref:ferritin-like domain-containing protein n=1 Tax=Thermanaeromonas sp. TaxID=2003697 RepID=UPI00243ED372|nr:ferritin-like domain-containing protein [Thermanaeromonas sp.]MCG0277842.1 ferritin-like domain-containing protein [Thermanaeromonas sp.]
MEPSYFAETFYKVIEGLRKALLDERATAVFYGQLRDISKTYAGVESFAEARKDELDHAKAITELLESLTGVKPKEATQPVSPPAFRNYCEGIMLAIKGEREAGVEYSNIIGISPYDRVNKILEEIINDEEVHLVKFSKLYELECERKYYSVSQNI